MLFGYLLDDGPVERFGFGALRDQVLGGDGLTHCLLVLGPLGLLQVLRAEGARDGQWIQRLNRRELHLLGRL